MATPGTRELMVVICFFGEPPADAKRSYGPDFGAGLAVQLSLIGLTSKELLTGAAPNHQEVGSMGAWAFSVRDEDVAYCLLFLFLPLFSGLALSLPLVP